MTKQNINNKDEEDYNFDFSMYESEEKEEEIGSLHKKLPLVKGLRSRFSNGENILNKFITLENEISKYAIRVGARTQKMTDCWTLYSIVDEYWDNFRHIYGSLAIKEMNEIRKHCVKLMEQSTNGNIPSKVHNNLLYFKTKVYFLAQVSNLRFEVDMVKRGVIAKAKRKIIQ